MAASARNRLTIAQALGLVALTALGLAALRNPTRLSSAVLLDLSLLIAVAGAIVGACGRGRSRAFCAGYAIAPLSYLLMQVVAAQPSGTPSKVYRSLPTRLLDYCFEAIPLITMTPASGLSSGLSGETIWVVTRPSGERFEYAGSKPPPDKRAVVDEYFRQIDVEAYRRLGHAVFSLIAGIAGGMLGHAVAPRGSKADPRTALDTDLAHTEGRA